jgi:DNA-binding transcriptional LysR family regulator
LTKQRGPAAPAARPAPATAAFDPRRLQPDANAIELFARVVAAGSFAQAARELKLTRAAISRRVAAIEAQLGLPLFARTTRALGLTEAGRRLAQRARTMAEAADAARRGLRSEARQGLGGTLRVTSVPIVGQVVLAPLLARFQSLNPELRLELLLTHRRLDLLREDVDVAFRLTAAPPPDWVATPLLPYAVRVYAAPGPLLARPEDLAQRRCLLLGAPGQPQHLIWQRPGTRRRASVTIEPAVVADDLATLIAIARAGDGVVFAPDFAVAADLAAGRLIDLLPGWQLPIVQGDQVVALTLPLPTAPEAARALVRFVAEALAPQP